MPTPPRIAALALPATVGAAQLLLPAGTFDAPRGAMLGAGPWCLSDDRGYILAEALGRRVKDIPVDYEHQTLRAAQNGQPAPAAGWVRPATIRFEPAVGLVAPVDWTARAAAAIGADEYRYLSPVFTYDARGRVIDLLHLALTNTPALDCLPAVALAAASLLLTPPESPMDELRERLLYLLNLPLTTTGPELLAQLDTLKSMLGNGPDGTAATSLPALLAARETRIAALTAQVQAAVPADLVADLQRQVAALTNDAQTRTRDTLLTAALSDGRLTPGSLLHTHAQSLVLPALQGLLGSLTPIAALSGTQTGGQAPEAVAAAAAAGEWTEALAQEFGSPEVYAAFQRAEAAGSVRIFGAAQ
ncbi:phage protease [Candidatus Thiodictyon syntrophicum]|jgi:phage I-like protein|uniref:Mu-like prophage I protein n=1 Tax=Candidatus Thiodictyon syntrophicum TaxID=1166950 RepID=A0A2K8UHZ3_9GAMM|nr:phage protease [Candidatus Thiodictyon syntrophicum]AUB85160.1 hypothetical protein THSYN_30025 [Candidatus Thiodictyon syntrophicum]